MPARSPCTTIEWSSGGTPGTRRAARPRTPTRRLPSIRKRSRPSAPGVTPRTGSATLSAATTTPVITSSRARMAAHHTRIHPAAFRPSHGSGRTITFHDLRHSYATGALKAGIHPKVVSDRIGHANVGFFLQTYAHVLGNDDRDAAEQAATFLLGEGWGLGEANNSQSDETV